MPSHGSKSEKERLQGLLRKIRQDAGLTQAELAAELGHPQSYVSKYESGEQRLDIFELRSFCEATGITLADFSARLEKLLK
jgi:transcriptional regulator with XRE-family HTH domain